MLLGFDWNDEGVTFSGELCPIQDGKNAGKLIEVGTGCYCNIYVGF